MAKTRSQTGNITIKKEEEDVKSTLLLNGVTDTRRSSRIAKRKPPVTNNRRLPAVQVKGEEETDTKALLKSVSKSSKGAPKPRISQEQINQLIDYIVNHSMSVCKAARKVKMSNSAGFVYRKLYKDDPEKKIPLPRYQTPKMHSQEQIGNLIGYINDDKMTVKDASAKQFHQTYTQDQKNEFIGYIVNDKMSITAASEKAKMNVHTAKDYYHKYFKVLNPDIARPSHIATRKSYTQEQKKDVISYIVDDKMSILTASRKANMDQNTAAKYYRRYLKDNAIEHYVPKNKPCSQDRINEHIRYIVDDKMSVTAASKKANMSRETGGKYYHQYLNKQNH